MKILLLTISAICQCALSVQAGSVNASDTQQLRDCLVWCSLGDTVYLSEGVYTGNYSIEKTLTIIGDQAAVIDGGGDGDVVTVSADSVEIKGIIIRGSGTRLLRDMSGIKVTGDHVTITDCRIIDNLHGIYIKGGKNATISNNVIVGRFNIQESDRGNGIHLWSTTGNIIENNDISYARDGIYFSFANKTQVILNHIHHLRYGLHYMYSDSNSFEDNLFDYNVAGSALMYSKYIEFRRNIFAHCRGFRAYGILLQSVDHCGAYDNLILDNTKAVFFSNSSFNRFEKNEIVQNDLAVQINVACEENSLVENNFVSNLAGVMMDVSVVTSTEWSHDGRGNYWSDYTGYDLDDNGIGDIPHQLQSIFEYLEQDNPAVRFYLYSPASQLLAAAEKRLPILRKNNVEDHHPVFGYQPNPDIPDMRRLYNKNGNSESHVFLWASLLLLPSILMWKIRK
jgi:nitrous oxidase accessory protein